MGMPLRRRPLVAILAVVGLGAAFVAGSHLDSDDGRLLAAGPEPMSYFGDLEVAESCEDLLEWYVDRGLELVGPYGWDGGMYAFADDSGGVGVGVAGAPAGAEAASSSAPALPGAVSQRATSGESGTNVQEVGVDEPDVVKTDGGLLVRIRGGELTTYDVRGGDVERLGDLRIDDLIGGEVLLVDDMVTAIGHDRGSEDDGGRTRVVTVDVSDPSAPVVVETAVFDARQVVARLHGDTVRLVLSAGLPELDFVQPDGDRGEVSAEEENEELVRATSLEDWLPGVALSGGDEEPLLDCSDVALPDDDLGLDTVSIVAFDAGEPASFETTALAAGTTIAYASVDHLYLATGGFGMTCCVMVGTGVPEMAALPPLTIGAQDGTTYVFDFALDDTATTYAASGEVDGVVADRWAMDESGGVLRVAVGPSQRTGNFNSVVTLGREGDDLVELGRVDKLGVNETIQSVRWFDGLAIVVTFRQVDPLYAVDLTDAEAPELLGELKIPGFSEYLHPLGTDRLVGIGQGPVGKNGWGAQAGLFDVTDLTDPRRIDVVSYGSGSWAGAGVDPRQFTWLPEQRTVLTVVSEGTMGRTGYVSVLRLDDGRMHNEMVEVEYGVEVDEVRTVPLPDGRVVLVTGEDVEFFDLSPAV